MTSCLRDPGGLGANPDGKFKGRERMSFSGGTYFLFVETRAGTHQCPHDQL